MEHEEELFEVNVDVKALRAHLGLVDLKDQRDLGVEMVKLLKSLVVKGLQEDLVLQAHLETMALTD